MKDHYNFSKAQKNPFAKRFKKPVAGAVVPLAEETGSVLHRLLIEYGDDVLFSSGLSRQEFDEQARFLLAAKLFELGRLSSGQAARLCGKERVDFLSSLSKVGISMSNLGPEDAEAELELLRLG